VERDDELQPGLLEPDNALVDGYRFLPERIGVRSAPAFPNLCIVVSAAPTRDTNPSVASYCSG
jgi:hypothetical protein